MVVSLIRARVTGLPSLVSLTETSPIDAGLFGANAT
jgi:hypothetical protein